MVTIEDLLEDDDFINNLKLDIIEVIKLLLHFIFFFNYFYFKIRNAKNLE